MIFGVDITSVGSWTVLRARGEVDLATAPKLRAALAGASRNDGVAGDVVVDLTLVDLVDSTGLGVLIGALRRANQQDTRLVLCGLCPAVRAVFDLTGLATLFEIVPSMNELPGTADEARPARQVRRTEGIAQ